MTRNTMRLSILAFVALALLCAIPARPVQQGNQPQPPPGQKPSSGESSSSSSSSSSQPAQQTQPNYDPFHAQQDVEVGTFYMHKGDVDAAIPRFEDAIRLRPDFAKPRLLLAEAYEKKHENETAVKYLKEYLQVDPKAPDAAKVRKKIEALSAH
ncbi:MAG: tetratricopeptide repeat protein [Candidatus Acidiferrales bacterium]